METEKQQLEEAKKGTRISPYQQVSIELAPYWIHGKPDLPTPRRYLEIARGDNNKTLEGLREKYGLRTSLSPEGQPSRRAQFFTKFAHAVDIYGNLAEGQKEAQDAVLNLQQAALTHLSDLLTQENPNASVVGILGSFKNRTPRLGIAMVGITYEQAHQEYFHLYPYENKTAHLPSDIDTALWGVSPALRERVFRILFQEYGVYFEEQSFQDLSRILPLPKLLEMGGIERYINMSR